MRWTGLDSKGKDLGKAVGSFLNVDDMTKLNESSLLSRATRGSSERLC